MRDFTLSKYKELLQELIGAGYNAITYADYCTLPVLPDKYVILRHDIDKQPLQALQFAKIDEDLGVKATYYFRIVKQSNNPSVIRAIADMGMEVGYHYEDMSICKGNWQQANRHFQESIAYIRKYYPVRTICVHGAPRSRIDNKTLWEHADYHDYGVIGEPYFDTDFNTVFYLTDTGRRWDGYRFSFIDKIPQQQSLWTEKGWVYHHTDDIITALRNNTFPPRILLTTHPQRWHNELWAWMYEWGRQHLVNVIKYILFHKSIG